MNDESHINMQDETAVGAPITSNMKRNNQQEGKKDFVTLIMK